MPQNYPMWSGAFWNLNERERREKKIEDEALQRELVKLAKQAEAEKAIAEMRDKAAEERVKIGESGAKERQAAELALRERLTKGESSDALERLILNNMSARELQGAEANAALTRDEAQYNRGKALEELKLKAANREATARSYNALTGLLEVGEEPTDEDRSLLGLPLRGGMQPGRLPAAGAGALPASGRRFSVSRPDGTSAKPGETPRNPDNAAPQVPVTVGPKPLNSGVSIIGGDKATLQGGPNIAQPTLSELMKQSAPPQWPYNTLAIDVGQPRTAKQPSLYQQLRNALPEELSGLLPENGVDALPSIKRDKAGELVEKYLLRQPAIKK